MLKGKKLIAMILIFTMTFSNFAFVTKSIAATSFVSLFGSDTGDENVEFEAFLSDGNDLGSAMIGEVNSENLAIDVQLDVKNSGYLKNAKVEIKPKDEDDLNFVINENNQVAENKLVQSLNDNVLEFNKIDNSSDKLEISIPIEYKMEDYIKESKLNSIAEVNLSGVYVNEKGKEIEISKEVELMLAWKDERTARIEDEVSKYIQFSNNGIILQTIVKVDSSNIDKKSLPVKETNVNIEVPVINNVKPSEVTVIANSTVGTNGKGVGEVEFNEDNWSYHEDENKLRIHVENNKELVEISNEEFLKTESEPIKEERYYSVAGTDEYVVTYVYKNVEILDEMDLNYNVNAEVIKFSGVNSDDNVSITTAEKSEGLKLTGQTGSLVSYSIENETKEISKIYGYLNDKETEFDSKTAINISYKDIVEGITVEDTANYYIDKEENKVEADDIYYKQLSINKENFVEILGEEGTVQISDISGNVLAIINKDTEVDENGNYNVNFQDRISKVSISTSKPVGEGNLIISNKKAVLNTSVDKQTYANLDYIATDTIQKAKFNYVSDIVDLGNCTIKTKLVDTKTDINLVVDRESLTTATENSNVEMRLELNNDKETSDIYGNSIFEIEMPEYVTNLNITNASMIYGEGLNISNVEAYSKDGKPVIKVAVEGKQENLNSGVLTNGTNIVLNADIAIDKYAPSINTEIKAFCYNSEATNYDNAVENNIDSVATICDAEEAKVEYSAPSGVVAINTLANYNNVGSTVTSIKQGEQKDYIDIYSEAKNATMEIAVINNNENSVSNLSVLGRIPFKGVKDLTTGKDLGTTIDTKMIRGIVSDEANQGEFVVYYSENGEATKELNDSSNGWIQNPENLDNIKSYLIVPSDSSYQLEAKKVLKFTYEYQIPENLPHNEEVYGTFLASYTNNYEGNSFDEVSKPDQVGLTTGDGPKVEMKAKTDSKKVSADEEFETSFIVKNSGKDAARDVSINIPVPADTTYVSAESNRDTANIQLIENTVVVNLPILSTDSTLETKVKFKVNETVNSNFDSFKVNAVATVKDLDIELKAQTEDIFFTKPDLILYQELDYNYNSETRVFKKGEEYQDIIVAINKTNEDRKDVTIEAELPKEIILNKAYMEEGTEEDLKKIENAEYDPSTNKVIWNLGTIPGEEARVLKIDFAIGDLNDGMTSNKVAIKAKAESSNSEIENAKDIDLKIGKSSVVVSQTTSTPTYVTEGDEIDYVFNIKNEGQGYSTNVVLKDLIPDGIIVKSMQYSIDGEEYGFSTSAEDDASVVLSIPGESEVNVEVKAIAKNLHGVKEKTITNEGMVIGSEFGESRSNSVTHIIQEKEGSDTEDESNSDLLIPDSKVTGDITKTYKISGIAWLDKNENGMRDDDETKMSNVTAILVDSNSGVIKSTTITNDKGEYIFTGIQNGSYLVVFKYDTVLYTTTTYKKEGVETDINSDAVVTKLEQDGRKENAAVTDVIQINGINANNIDIGLVEAEKFSLSLDKSITKVTVQNKEGTKTEEFEKTKLAKYDIAAKYLSGTTVFVEYTMTVTNNGDLSGFASEIVDYVPQGMTFNSTLNPDWYSGTDGSLYTKALADVELASGESRTITLVLTKQMTAENTGLVSNTAEISDDYNIYGVSDNNSKPSNKAQGEDDISTADTILTVKTGEALIYVSAIIISVIVGCAVAFIVYEKWLKNKAKGGV